MVIIYLKVGQRNDGFDLKQSLMNLKYMTAILHMSNMTVSVHKITNIINMQICFSAEDMISDWFYCYQLQLQTFVVSEQRCTLTRWYAITYETNR